MDTLFFVFRRTLTKTLRRPVVLSFSFVQPLIWMLLFGFLFERYRLESTHVELTYIDFLVPGVCCMTVLFGASQSGIELVRDLQTGFLPRMLETPADRRLIMAGKVAADVTRLLGQAVIVLALGVLLGARIYPSLSAAALAIANLVAFGVAFSSLSSSIALLTRAQESMAVFVHLVNMPLLFTSTALVPREQMPGFLSSAAAFNPLSLAVDSLRQALLFGEAPPAMHSLLPLLVIAVALFALASAALARTVRDRD